MSLRALLLCWLLASLAAAFVFHLVYARHGWSDE